MLDTLFPVTVTAPQDAPMVGAPHEAVTPEIPAGTASVNTVRLAPSGPALVTVDVYVMVVPQGIVDGPLFVTPTFATPFTVNDAVAAAAFEPAFVDKAPIAMALLYEPAVAAVTSI